MNIYVKDGVEIKTIFLVDQNKKTAGLMLRYLLNQAANLAIEIRASCLFGTVSAKKPEVLKVMLKLGFQIATTFQGKYLENTDEYLIYHPRPYDLLMPNLEN